MILTLSTLNMNLFQSTVSYIHACVYSVKHKLENVHPDLIYSSTKKLAVFGYQCQIMVIPFFME